MQNIHTTSLSENIVNKEIEKFIKETNISRISKEFKALKEELKELLEEINHHKAT